MKPFCKFLLILFYACTLPFFLIKTLIQYGCIKLIKSDSKYFK